MGIDTMNDDGGGIHIGSDAASVYPLTTDFSLGSSTSYGRYDHQAPIQNATVTGLRVQSPSRAMLSSMVPMVAPSRNPFASSEWSSGLVFNYGLDVAPHFDAPVASTSRSANSYSLKSWPVSQYSEQSTTSALLTHAVQSNMAILPQYQTPPAPIVQPEVVVDTVPTNEGPKLPEIYATIPLPPTNEQTASDRKKDGRKHACHMCHKSFDRYVYIRYFINLATSVLSRSFPTQTMHSKKGDICSKKVNPISVLIAEISPFSICWSILDRKVRLITILNSAS